MAYVGHRGRESPLEYYYDVVMKVNGVKKHSFSANGLLGTFLNSYDGRNFEVNYDLRRNDKVVFNIYSFTSHLYTHGLPFTTDSFVEGKLSKKNN